MLLLLILIFINILIMIERLQFSFITNYYHSAKQSLKQSIIIHNYNDYLLNV